jgi:hypothetical protein
MAKLTTQFLLTNLVFLLLFVSCGSNAIVKDYKAVAIEKSVFMTSFFSDPTIDYVYKANIKVYGHELSGIFIAKKIGDNIHRVVFTTEFGNKLLDFEISENDFKINAIVPELNRKLLINTLQTDFQLLLKKEFVVKEQYEDTTKTVLMSLDKNNYNFLLISKPDNKLMTIIHASKRKEKVNINFTAENNTFAEKIVVQHTNINLRMELTYFKN